MAVGMAGSVRVVAATEVAADTVMEASCYTDLVMVGIVETQWLLL